MRIRFPLGALALIMLTASPYPARADDANETLIKQGEYLTRAGDCIACHSAPGGKPYAGGLAMATPFGTITTPNITPDKATGIGDWSDDQFYRALHEGIGHRGEYLYPVFPFPWFTKVKREDVLAIKAYLFSLPAENAPRKPFKFMFPFNIRETLLTWRAAFFKPATFVPDPNKSEEVNRGAYLVEGLGHCGECHNHNNLLGASDWSGKLKGGQIDGWYAPNITSDGKQGVGQWSTEQIVTFLHDGIAPDSGVVVGPMKQTVEESLRYMSDADLRAIAAYLKSFSGAQTYKPLDASQVASASGGADAYLSNCASCHGIDGQGVKGMIPALAGNGAVKAAGPENVIRVVVAGLPASHGLAPMPAAGSDLSDEQVAAIVNYVRTAWGNAAPANAEPGKVAKLRGQAATLMSATPATGCAPSDAAPALAQGLKDAGLPEAFKGVRMSEMLQQIDAVLPKVKASAPTATNDDIVNAMIAAYCPVALADDSVPPAERTALLGSFGGLAYGQINAMKDDKVMKN